MKKGKNGIIILLLFCFSPCVFADRICKNDSQKKNPTPKENYTASSDSVKRKKELEWILSVLPPDEIHRGRVSYLDETFKDWLGRTGELPPDFDKMPSLPFLPNPLVMDEGGSDTPVISLDQWNTQRDWMKQQLERYITGTAPPPPDNLQSDILQEKDLCPEESLTRA